MVAQSSNRRLGHHPRVEGQRLIIAEDEKVSSPGDRRVDSSILGMSLQSAVGILANLAKEASL